MGIVIYRPRDGMLSEKKCHSACFAIRYLPRRKTERRRAKSYLDARNRRHRLPNSLFILAATAQRYDLRIMNLAWRGCRE